MTRPAPGSERGEIRRTFLQRILLGGVALLGGAGTRQLHAGEPDEPAALPTGRGPEPFIGEIIAVPYTFAPRDFAFCEGQTLPISGNDALFALLGVNYGGDGRRTFQLPDTRDVEAAAQKAGRHARPPFRYAIAISGVFPSRS